MPTHWFQSWSFEPRRGGVDSPIAKSSEAFLFIWTLIALGVTGLFSVILSARGLWNLKRAQAR